MHAILITMSSKRRAQIQEDPDTLADVLEARHEPEIPGLLDLGTAWNALDTLLSEGGKDTVLGDAVLAVSFTPYASETAALTQAAREKQARIVSITDSAFSPIAPVADLWFEIVEANFEGFRSMAATMALAMTLAVAVAGKREG